MSNHFYTFGGNIYRQNDGGAIGADLTGKIARCVMSLWDVTYMRKLREAGIHIDLYKRYVDDQLDVCPPITPGWTYNPKNRRMEYSEEIAKIDTDSPAIRTAKVLQDIANSIDECIRVTYDTPENNDSGKLPVLDLEVWVHNNVISHSFYKK